MATTSKTRLSLGRAVPSATQALKGDQDVAVDDDGLGRAGRSSNLTQARGHAAAVRLVWLWNTGRTALSVA